jgi:hypothetical protein
MIKAHRRYRVTVDVLANGEGELVIMAPDEGTAEEMAQQGIEAGAFNDFFKENNAKFNLDISIVNIEDIGNAITGE